MHWIVRCVASADQIEFCHLFFLLTQMLEADYSVLHEDSSDVGSTG